MSNYTFVAIDPSGRETRGRVEVADQAEAVRRIKEMGLFPTRILADRGTARRAPKTKARPLRQPLSAGKLRLPFGGRVKGPILAVFTRQLATLIEAGLPLLRGLRLLEEQAEHRTLKRVIGELAADIEGGCSFAEAIAAHPRIFSKLYLNMVKAGELGGALDVTLTRLAEFMEKYQKLKGRLIAAMVYPCAVMTVATAVLVLLMVFIVPRFREIYAGLFEGRPLPVFTMYVMNLSSALQHHFLALVSVVAALVMTFLFALRTHGGRWAFDLFKLRSPVVGPVFRKAAISRFARTFGTLASSGVPILQALLIVKETAANQVVSGVIGDLHDQVKQGDALAPTLKASSIFPAMVAGMVDVGEQTGALPEMLLKIADRYDEEVDNATAAMTSLLEPVMIVVLGIIVGAIVIALFLPLIPQDPSQGPGARSEL